MRQGLKDPPPPFRAARRSLIFFGGGGFWFEGKAICTHATQCGCCLTLPWRAAAVATRMFVRTGTDFGCCRKTWSFN